MGLRSLVVRFGDMRYRGAEAGSSQICRNGWKRKNVYNILSKIDACRGNAASSVVGTSVYYSSGMNMHEMTASRLRTLL